MIHLVKHDYDTDQLVNVVVAECGATALILPDATLSPGDFDFVGPDDPRGICDCAPCKLTALAKLRARVMETEK